MFFLNKLLAELRATAVPGSEIGVKSPNPHFQDGRCGFPQIESYSLCKSEQGYLMFAGPWGKAIVNTSVRKKCDCAVTWHILLTANQVLPSSPPRGAGCNE